MARHGSGVRCDHFDTCLKQSAAIQPDSNAATAHENAVTTTCLQVDQHARSRPRAPGLDHRSSTSSYHEDGGAQVRSTRPTSSFRATPGNAPTTGPAGSGRGTVEKTSRLVCPIAPPSGKDDRPAESSGLSAALQPFAWIGRGPDGRGTLHWRGASSICSDCPESGRCRMLGEVAGDRRVPAGHSRAAGAGRGWTDRPGDPAAAARSA